MTAKSRTGRLMEDALLDMEAAQNLLRATVRVYTTPIDELGGLKPFDTVTGLHATRNALSRAVDALGLAIERQRG